MIIAQGGNTNGRSLYAKDGKKEGEGRIDTTIPMIFIRR